MIDLDKMAAEAAQRVRERINRSAAQHKRAIRKEFQQLREAIADANN